MAVSLSLEVRDMNHVRALRRFRLSHRSTLLAAASLFALAVPATASAQVFLTETFSTVPMDAQRVRISSDIAGTALTVTNGVVEIRTDNSDGGRGNYMYMPLGVYQPVFTPGTGTGTAAFQSTRTFDLFAGVQYTLSFDWTHPESASGNGPFPLSLTARLGNHSLLLNDNTGFLYGLNWQTATLTFTPETTELGAIMSFAGTGTGYSGVYLDNISMVGLESQPPTPGVVPEPTTWALLVTGLAMLALLGRRRVRATAA
jgi:hypothetical protein